MEQQLRVLVVDDEQPVRLLLARILEGGGYQVTQAADGEEALEKIAEGEVDVLMLDMMMPKMTGTEVLRRLSADRLDICVLMVTAVVDVTAAVETMKLGALDYITKPFEQADVLWKVESAVRLWNQLLQERHSQADIRQNIADQTQRMQDQFNELMLSLSREHRLIQKLAAAQPDGGKKARSQLPPELRDPISSMDDFKDALLRILKRS